MPDLGREPFAFLMQGACTAVHLAGGRAGIRCAAVDLTDIGGDMGRTAGRLLNVPGDLLRRRALFFDGGRNG